MRNSSNWALAASCTFASIVCAAPAATAATLTGTVFANGRAVDSAVVNIYVKAPGARKFVTITNVNGAYRFTNVLNGPHVLIVEKDGKRIYQGVTDVQQADAKFDIKL